MVVNDAMIRNESRWIKPNPMMFEVDFFAYLLLGLGGRVWVKLFSSILSRECQSSSSSQFERGRLVGVSEMYSLIFDQEKCKTSSSSQFGRGGCEWNGENGSWGSSSGQMNLARTKLLLLEKWRELMKIKSFTNWIMNSQNLSGA